MKSNHRKFLILAVKLSVAVALMAWVLNRTHWNDFIRTRDGQTYPVISGGHGEGEWQVRTGMLWWSGQRTLATADLEPVGEQAGVVRRPGFASSIRGIRVGLLAAAGVGWLAALFVITIRWWLLLRIQDIRISLWEAIRLSFLGQFFNLVVPGTVGGDLVKAYYAAKHTPRKAAVLLSVFVDRLLGLAELTLIASLALAVALATGLGNWADPMMKSCATAVGVAVAMLAFVVVVMLSVRLRNVLHLQKFYRRLRIAHQISAAGDAVRLYRRRWRHLARAIVWTIGAPFMWVASAALVGQSLALEVSWHEYFLYIPLIYIIGAVPLTPGGVGWIENLYLAFFVVANPSGVLAFALLARLIPMFWALPGVVVAFTGPRTPEARAMQAELGM
jgi:hypothetical protein